MTHNIISIQHQPIIRYREIVRGQFFSFADSNVQGMFIKIGTKAINLNSGYDLSVDQLEEVVLVPENATITITITVRG